MDAEQFAEIVDDFLLENGIPPLSVSAVRFRLMCRLSTPAVVYHLIQTLSVLERRELALRLSNEEEIAG